MRSRSAGIPCAYCNTVQPERRASREELAAAVRAVLREDLDGDGRPDVWSSGRSSPVVSPAQTSASNDGTYAPDDARKRLVVTMLVGGVLSGFLIAAIVPLLSFQSEEPGPQGIVANDTPQGSPPAGRVTSNVPEPSVSPSEPEAPAIPEKPAAPSTPVTPSKPVVKLTNEQWGKNVVSAQRKKLLECVEQDLLRDPNVPKAYAVTVLVERDGLPLNTATTFSPKATRGFTSCARNVIFYGFGGDKRGAPEKGEFTFTTSFSFPDAKPASKAQLGRGWD